MRVWLLLMALAAADPVPIGPDDALPIPMDPAVADIWERGQRSERVGDVAAASIAYRIVVRSDPSWVPGLLALGRTQEQLGRPEEALATYRRSSVPEVLVARAALELSLDRPSDALRTYARLRRSAPSAEVVRLQALAEVRVDAMSASARLREWLAWPDTEDVAGLPAATVEQDAATVLTVVEALVDANDPEQATALLRDATVQRPDLLDVGGVSERLDSLLLDAEARQWMRSGAVPLDIEQSRRLHDLEDALRAEQWDTVGPALDRLVRDAPRSAAVWATVARYALATGDVRSADAALQQATFLAPSDPNHAAALGDLLAERYAGREDIAAVDAYRRALRRDPLWASVWWRLAVVEQRAGLGDRGVEALSRYLALEPDGRHAADAELRLVGLQRERPPTPPLPDEPEPPQGVSRDALLAYHRAGVLRARGERDAALDELRRVRALAPGFADAVNLQGSLFLDTGERALAIEAYARSLDLDANQPSVVLTLWDLLRREGRDDEADDVLAAAQATGIADVEALFARAAVDEGRFDDARAHLDRFDASPHTDRFVGEARELTEALDARDRRLRLGAFALAGSLVVLALLWPVSRLLRRRGASLASFVQARPSAAREAVSIAAAVRHEVLKHDTTVLFQVADAIDSGDVDAGPWAAERLFGSRGTVARFREQVDALHELSRAHGMRLDLRREDPVFSSLIAAMGRLTRLRRGLERGRVRIVPELRAIAVALNEVGFSELGALVSSLSLLSVDDDLVNDVVHRIAGESAGVGGPAVTVDVADEPMWVRLFRGELEDVLANLVRNALAASIEHGGDAVWVSVTLEVDDLTFREQVRIAVADRVPRPLTTADIHDRPLERGLGIVSGLVAKNDGSVVVEPLSGWAKAVVVRLPAVEVTED